MITLTAPVTLTLKPETIGVVLDTLAKSGPWHVINPIMEELMAQLRGPSDASNVPPPGDQPPEG